MPIADIVSRAGTEKAEAPASRLGLRVRSRWKGQTEQRARHGQNVTWVGRRGEERLYIFISNLFDELAAGLRRNAARYPLFPIAAKRGCGRIVRFVSIADIL